MKKIPDVNTVEPAIRILDMSLPDDELIPAKNDRTVIIPMYDDAERACRVAADFRKAGILTLGMSPVAVDDDLTCFDGIMYMNEYGCYMMGDELIRRIELPGPVKLDADDLRRIIYDSCRYIITSYRVQLREHPFNELLEYVAKEFGYVNFSNSDRVMLIITVNPKDTTLTVEEMKTRVSKSSFVPDGVDLIWGIHSDDTIPEDSVGAMAIIAGEKNIEIRDEFDERLEEFE